MGSAAEGAQVGAIAQVNWWPWLTIQWEARKKLETQNKTLEDYDIPNARSMIGGSYCGQFYNSMRMAAAINEGFVTGQLWGLPIDYQTFLMDKALSNTRQPFTFPLMQTMNQRIMGYMSGISVLGKAEPIGQKATSRLDEQMLRASAMAMAAMQGPEIAAVMAEMGIPPDVEEAKKFVHTNYQDPFRKAINLLLAAIADRGKYKDMLKPLIQNLNVSGLCAIHTPVSGGRYAPEVIDSRYIFYDPKSRKPDMSDGSFRGFFKFWSSVSALAEAYDLDKDIVTALEESLTFQYQNDSGTWPANGLVSVVMYYDDGEWIEQAFIDGPNGPEMVSVNEKDPITGENMYEEKDFIDPPKIELTKDWKGKKQKCFYKTTRCAEFIPREFMPPAMNIDKWKGDLPLRGGLWPLQEVNPEDQQGTRSPLVMATWMNINGHVIAPLTALMAPQRIISQITTDIMWRMNKASVPFLYFDKRALSQGGGANIKQIAADAKQGDAVYGDTSHIGGAQNAVQMVGGGIDPNIFKQWEILEKMVRFAEEAIGIFSQNSGGPGPANQLVGVKEMQARQQEVMLRPLIDAIQSVMQQQHQQDASAGRRFYAQRRWILENMVGTEAADIIIQSASDELEQFRLTTTIMVDPQQEMEATRALILGQGGLLDRQLLGPVQAGELLSQSYTSDVWPVVERYTKMAAANAERQAQQQATAQAAAALGEQEENIAQREFEMYNKYMDVAAKSDATQVKADLPALSAQAKAVLTPPEQVPASA